MSGQVSYNGLQVVYPTRNRAALAIGVIRSVLAQAEGDVRVLVSDNSTETADRDALGVFIAELNDERVCSIAPPQSLPVGPHWDWALEQAMARSDKNHFTVLTDRLLFKHNALRPILELTRTRPEQLLSYPRENVFDHQSPVRFKPYPATGRMVEISAARLLALTAHGRLHPATPLLFNCIVPRALLEQVKARYGNYAASLSPDCAFGYRALERIESLTFFDSAPLLVHGYKVSTSYGHMRGSPTPSTLDFYASANLSALQATVPAPEFPSMLNVLMHEYALVQQAASSPKAPPIERNGYLDLLESEVNLLEDVNLRRARQQQLDGLRGTPRRGRRVVHQLLARAAALRARRGRPFEFTTAPEAVQFVQNFSAPYLPHSRFLDIVT